MPAGALSSQTGSASPWRKHSFKHWDLSFDTSWIYIDILVFHESKKRLQLFIKGLISLVAAVRASGPRWPHHPPLQLLPQLVPVNSKQGETLPRKQPAFPPGSRCFPPPRSLLSPNIPLLYTSQWTWADDSCPGAVGREPTPALCCPPSCLASLEVFINWLWHIHCGYQLSQEPYATLEDKI